MQKLILRNLNKKLWTSLNKLKLITRKLASPEWASSPKIQLLSTRRLLQEGWIWAETASEGKRSLIETKTLNRTEA